MLTFQNPPVATVATYPTGPSGGCQLGPGRYFPGKPYSTSMDIYNATAIVRLMLPDDPLLGNTGWHWSDDYVYTPRTGLVFPGAVGFAARSYTAANIASVFATVQESGDVYALGGTPTSLTLSSGQVVVTSGITGQISAAGAITAGTGFAINGGHVQGLYTITYTTAFAAVPTLNVSLFATGVRLIQISAQSAAAFTVRIIDSGNNLQDEAFNFYAVQTA